MSDLDRALALIGTALGQIAAEPFGDDADLALRLVLGLGDDVGSALLSRAVTRALSVTAPAQMARSGAL